eukprot:SAG11_NODE_10589_length_819_cov_0.713889_1_plen_206_part_01
MPTSAETDADGNVIVGRRVRVNGYGDGEVVEFVKENRAASAHVIRFPGGVKRVKLARKGNNKTPWQIWDPENVQLRRIDVAELLNCLKAAQHKKNRELDAAREPVWQEPKATGAEAQVMSHLAKLEQRLAEVQKEAADVQIDALEAAELVELRQVRQSEREARNAEARITAQYKALQQRWAAESAAHAKKIDALELEWGARLAEKD